MDTKGKILLLASGVGALTLTAMYVRRYVRASLNEKQESYENEMEQKPKIDHTFNQESTKRKDGPTTCTYSYTNTNPSDMDSKPEEDGPSTPEHLYFPNKEDDEGCSKYTIRRSPSRNKATDLLQIEERLFLELDGKITLTKEQLNMLVRSAFQDTESINRHIKIDKLSDLLTEMSYKKFFPEIKSYRSVITNVFVSSGIQIPAEFEQHLLLFEQKLRESQIFDGIILHTDDDREKASKVVSVLSETLNFKIGLIEEVAVARASLISLDTIFQETRYLLVLVTESYSLDAFTRYFAESGLTKCLLAHQWRVIPLWAENIAMSERPAELKALKGIKCHKLCSDIRDLDAERCFSNLLKIR